MWIEELSIGDFGCFFDSRFQGFENGLNVIAGPQRAGKTTFMEVIRRLGYGIRRGDDLPPPADRYAVRATVHYDGYEYSIELDHYAEPRVTALDDSAPDRSARELFGDVRKEQYKQIYTISLDELRRDPDSLEDGIDLSRVLLGAGYGEASDLPDIVEALKEDAHAIGRTTGLRGGPIREAIKTIEAGIEEKDAAVAQVDEFDETEADLTAVRGRIDAIGDEIERLEAEATRLEVLEAEFDDYERLLELRTRLEDADLEPLETFPIEDLERVRTLAERYQSARESLRTGRNEFASNVSADDPEEYRERLLSEQESLERFQNQVARFRSDADRLEQEATDLAGEWESLNDRIAELNPRWDTVDDISEFDTDLFTRADVRERIQSYRDADERVSNLNDQIDTRSSQVGHLEDRIETATNGQTAGLTSGLIVRAALGVGVAIGLGAVVASQTVPILGVGITAIAMLGIGAWLFRVWATATATHDGVNVEHLRAQKQEHESEVSSLREQLDDAEEHLDETWGALEEVQTEYDIPESTPPGAIEELYNGLVDVKARKRELERREDRLGDERADLTAELAGVAELLEDVGVIEDSIDDPLDESDRVCSSVERASSHLEDASSVATSERAVIELEEELRPYLDQWDELDTPDPGDDDFPDAVSEFLDRGEDLEAVNQLQEEFVSLEAGLNTQLEKGSVASAFDPIRDELDAADPPPLDAFDAVYQQYESTDAVVERLASIETRLTELDAEDSDCRDEQARLESRLDDLQSDDDVREAHQIIQQGQAKLEDRLESYAQYKIAEYLLDELHEQYLDRTTGPLIERASGIFDRITNGEYETIESTNEFEDLDFVANLSSGTSQTSTELSRATAEQLFLAVRLARIQLSEESLPILIDDSLTNFDPGHVHRTLDALSELGDDQQIFLLTCHPTMIDHVDVFHDAGYWSLDDGSVDGPNPTPEEAKTLLQRDSPLIYPDPTISTD